MRLSEPRLLPITDEEADDAQRALIEGMADADGYTLNIFRTLAHHPDLARRWLVFATHVLLKSTLPVGQRELAILRIGWLCRSEYEWGQHVVIGRAGGLTDEEIDRIKDGPDGPGWSPAERAVLRATDELHHDQHIGDATWARLSEHLSTQQIMDLVFAVGQYTLVSMALNTLGVQADPDQPGFDL